MQFIFRNEPGDAYLAAVSKFILNAFDFGDATAPEESLQPDDATASLAPPTADQGNATETRKRAESISTPHNAPYLSMCPSRYLSSSYFADLQQYRPCDLQNGHFGG